MFHDLVGRKAYAQDMQTVQDLEDAESTARTAREDGARWEAAEASHAAAWWPRIQGTTRD